MTKLPLAFVLSPVEPKTKQSATRQQRLTVVLNKGAGSGSKFESLTTTGIDCWQWVSRNVNWAGSARPQANHSRQPLPSLSKARSVQLKIMSVLPHVYSADTVEVTQLCIVTSSACLLAVGLVGKVPITGVSRQRAGWATNVHLSFPLSTHPSQWVRTARIWAFYFPIPDLVYFPIRIAKQRIRLILPSISMNPNTISRRMQVRLKLFVPSTECGTAKRQKIKHFQQNFRHRHAYHSQI